MARRPRTAALSAAISTAPRGVAAGTESKQRTANGTIRYPVRISTFTLPVGIASACFAGGYTTLSDGIVTITVGKGMLILTPGESNEL